MTNATKLILIYSACLFAMGVVVGKYLGGGM